MKNPELKPLRIVRPNFSINYSVGRGIYAKALGDLAIAEAILVRAGKSSALPHFLAIVKEMESLCDFKFEVIDGGETPQPEKGENDERSCFQT